ncbi:hypothetical protein [[Eubacterium] cellulosolvens]
MARSKRRGKKKGLTVNFDEVEVGGRNVPDGKYKVRFDSYEEEQGNEYPYWSCKFKVVGGNYDGAILYDNISHSPAAHFKIAQLMRCLGFELPEGESQVDADDFIDEEGLVEVMNEEYDGKDKPRIVEYLAPSDEEEEEDEEEDEEEEYEEDGEEEEEEDEEEDEEEEEEEEKPKRGRGKAKAKGKSRAKPKRIRVGSKVSFEDDEGDTVKGVVTELDGDTVWVEDSAGDVWEVDKAEVS